MQVVILTDSSCDLPIGLIKDSNVEVIGLMCNFNNKQYEDDLGQTLPYKEFYDGIRNGEIPTTSQVNVYRFYKKFEKLIKEEKAVIYIGFDSRISGTLNSAFIARQQIIEKYKNADITVIDTKCASIGEGLLVYEALNVLKNGKSKEEIVQEIEDISHKMNHWFIVENLFYLKRGGRLSSTKAVVGTILNMKPIIFINDDGELINVCNIRGRKKAIRYLASRFNEMHGFENKVIGISHGDCVEDAEYLAEIMKSEFGVKKVLINYVGPVIGSHVGAGMLSLCFLAKNDRNI
ncbi:MULTISPECIES: DegV family protein [Clostridium]|uniref:DegV family protein n=1 Tax=Clostridium TaxID=1485 RepID=UPI0008263334|nr:MULTISPECIES: DegV family protein [Clostridium]PJI07914.1 DegV family protein [Clostridium sp. CT7]